MTDDTTEQDPATGDQAAGARELEVFWRPGCGFCARLRHDLQQFGVEATWRDIWQDEQAAAIVRAANDGNETVPTVRIGETLLTNPSAQQVLQHLS